MAGRVDSIDNKFDRDSYIDHNARKLIELSSDKNGLQGLVWH